MLPMHSLLLSLPPQLPLLLWLPLPPLLHHLLAAVKVLELEVIP